MSFLTIAQELNDIKNITDYKVRQKLVQAFARVQVRLGMGIPGATYPQEIEGFAAKRHAELDRLFVKHGDKGPTEPNIGWILNLTR